MSNLATRLDALADRLQPQIDHKFAPRLSNTPKRAREAASAVLDGLHLERTQKALRTLSRLHAAGTVPDALQNLKTKTVVHELTRAELHCSGGYYDAPRETGAPANKNPGALILWDLIKDNDASARLEQEELRRKLDAVRFSKIPGFFSTHAPVIERMAELAGLTDEPAKLLEPSAGSGNILDFVQENYPKVQLSAFEIAPSLQEILKLKGYELEGSDFLEPTPRPIYDYVLMNPPFEREQDIIHVQHALRWLKEGGRLVSVLSGATPTRQSKRAQVFRNIVAAHDGWFEDLPEGSFKDSGTGVSTALVVIEK